MGLSFDDYTVARLTSDCGGHPYLIRILCSHIHKYIKNSNIDRPCIITQAIYDKVVKDFEKTREATGFFNMILNILMTSYQTEYNTLKYLALGQDIIISDTQHREALQHLLGYGLIEYNHGNYAIRYNTVARFLRGENKYERQDLSVEEQKEEIYTRLNAAEISLRKRVRDELRSKHGADNAKKMVITAMQGYDSIKEKDVRKASQLEYKQLFDTSVNKMYFPLLKVLILNNISDFTYVFEGQTEKEIQQNLDIINQARWCADHSYTDDSENWSWEKFDSFRKSMKWLERILKNYD